VTCRAFRGIARLENCGNVISSSENPAPSLKVYSKKNRFLQTILEDEQKMAVSIKMLKAER